MILALLIAAAVAPGTYAVDPGASTLRYVVVHKLHKVDATSNQVEGRAVVKPDGSALTEVRAQVASFKSGDGNRDEHMLETMNVGSYPYVTFKGVAKSAAESVNLQGQVDFHGVKKPYTVPVKIEAQPDGTLHVTGGFDISLDSHNVDRPSLLFVKVDDACHIDVDLTLHPAK
jgi:polyisoprenoid-binding protein YceI